MQQNQMRISTYFPDVLIDDVFNGEYEKHIKTKNATLTSKQRILEPDFFVSVHLMSALQILHMK